MIYIFTSIFLFSLHFLLRNYPKESNFMYYIILFLLFIFSAFRFEVGCDWLAYDYYFEKIKNVDWLTGAFRRDWLWFFITKHFTNLGFSYLSLNIISSLIFFMGIHVLARRQPSPLGFLVILFPILIINMPMSAIRQGAAIGLVCIALVYFIERRRFLFILWIFLASGLHFSAIIMLFLFPFISGPLVYRKILFYIPIVGLILFAALTSETGQQAIRVYTGNNLEAHGAIFRLGLLMLSGLYFHLFAKNKWKQTYPKDYNLVNIGSIGMILMIFLTPISSVIGDRFGYFLIPIQAIIFARFYFLPFRSNHLIQSLIPYIGILFIFLIWTFFSWHFKECYIPYKNWII